MNISHSVTPYIQTSEACEKKPTRKLSGAHLQSERQSESEKEKERDYSVTIYSIDAWLSTITHLQQQTIDLKSYMNYVRWKGLFIP